LKGCAGAPTGRLPTAVPARPPAAVVRRAHGRRAGGSLRPRSGRCTAHDPGGRGCCCGACSYRPCADPWSGCDRACRGSCSCSGSGATGCGACCCGAAWSAPEIGCGSGHGTGCGSGCGSGGGGRCCATCRHQAGDAIGEESCVHVRRVPTCKACCGAVAWDVASAVPVALRQSETSGANKRRAAHLRLRLSLLLPSRDLLRLRDLDLRRSLRSRLRSERFLSDAPPSPPSPSPPSCGALAATPAFCSLLGSPGGLLGRCSSASCTPARGGVPPLSEPDIRSCLSLATIRVPQTVGSLTLSTDHAQRCDQSIVRTCRAVGYAK
jgi:hypothetical protein